MLEALRDRDNYSRDEIIRVACMATAGSTAGDIARALRTTPRAIYQLCWRSGIQLVDKSKEEEIVRLRILRQHFDVAGKISEPKEADPVWFLSRVIRVVLSDKELTTKVVERVFK